MFITYFFCVVFFYCFQQWKRRYFVLQGSASQMPQTATLIYYKDDKCKDKKGTIDLEHCEEVLSSLDSPIYPHLFGIKTVGHKKGTSRTYYLAAPNEQDMTTWVNSLCTVLGLKENNGKVAFWGTVDFAGRD